MSNAQDTDPSDFLIDYMDDLVKKDNGSSGPYTVWTPKENGPLVFSGRKEHSNTMPVDNTAELNSNILSKKNSNILGLRAEDIYRTVSELSVDDLNFFSPKIEIYRKLPASLTLSGEVNSSDDSTKYVYKKMDFVDGWNSFDKTNITANILNGQSGLGVAAITDAVWDLQASQGALEQNSELFDFLGKFQFSISKFTVNFYFDSIMTFFGNSQNNNSQLITDFMVDPKTNLQKMSQANIEGDDITRNYVYLMFLSDIDDETNDTNALSSKNNKLAYNFMIKVGYEPVEYNFDDIIQDVSKRERIKRFNSILRDYSDYYNLFFDCKLSTYDFKFAKDNSIKLTCEFIGSGRQGGLRDPFSHRTSNMDFFPILESLVETEEKRSLDDLKTELKNKRFVINQYDLLSRTNCFDVEDTKQYKNQNFYNSLVEEANVLETQINNLKQQAIRKLLYGTNINVISLPNERFAKWQQTISQPTGSIFEPSFANDLINSKSIQTIEVNTFQNNASLAQREKADAAANITGKNNFVNIAGDTTTTVSYFFFGSIVENIISQFLDKQPQIKINCIMPNITIYKRTRLLQNSPSPNQDPKKIVPNTPVLFGDDKISINAAYVPISLELWREWCSEYIVKKQRDYYHLFDLLNDLKALLSKAINYKSKLVIEKEPVLERLIGKPFVYSSFYQTTFNVKRETSNRFVVAKPNPALIKENEVKTLFGFDIGMLQNSDFQEINIIGYVSEFILPTLEIEQIIASTDSSDVNNPLTYITSGGNYEKDMKLGIIHFFIGNQLGIAKDFTFSSTVAPNGREIALSDDQRSDRGIQSINHNDVTIKVVGGNFFRPMELIYVHPHYTFGEPFDNKLNMSNILNIGGYYKIIKVSSTFSSKGVYETEIVAKFSNFIQASAISKKCKPKITKEFIDAYNRYTLGSAQTTIEDRKPSGIAKSDSD